jgi:hypothetical protein
MWLTHPGGRWLKSSELSRRISTFTELVSPTARCVTDGSSAVVALRVIFAAAQQFGRSLSEAVEPPSAC